MSPATPTATDATATDKSHARQDVAIRQAGPAGSSDGALHAGERAVVAGVFILITLLATLDLVVDLRTGVTLWHMMAEATVAIAACFGAFHLLRGAWRLRRRLEAQRRDFSAFRQQAEAWRTGSRKYLDGLSRSISLQLDQWQLTPAEKEVAFLLLKGLSLREIATARHTTEKTAGVQSSAVYTKSGLAGRSEMSAFFLEDLLPPDAASTNAAEDGSRTT
jgi:DNA-binding CsgD family transcriptional regulator